MENKKNILIVEDETPLLKIIQTKLEACGFSTFLAQNVPDALKILNENKINAIWLDHYLLGNKSGFDLVVELKSGLNKDWENIPIFVVSNTASPEKVQSYIKLGIKKYYVKASSSLNQIVNDIIEYLE